MVSHGKSYSRNRRGGRFFGRRVNCEQVPLLPTWAVGQFLDDPRDIPYLLIWTSRSEGTVQEAVRITRESSHAASSHPLTGQWTGWIEIKRPDGDCTYIRTARRLLPRNGANALFLVCQGCQKERRAVYGWVSGGQYTTSVYRSHWQCRRCTGLRYATEGGALMFRGRGRLGRAFGVMRSDRPEPWYPYVFTSPEHAGAAGFRKMNGGC
jgi:hypothetical protein